MKSIRFPVLALALLGMNGFASATECDVVLSMYSEPSCDATCRAQFERNHPECFVSGTSDAAASHRQLTGTSVQQILAISSAISANLSGLAPGAPWVLGQSTGKGMAAGAAAKPWNAWGQLANTDTSYEQAGNAASKSSGDVLNTILGVDYRIAPTMVVGFSAAFDDGSGALGAADTATDTRGYNLAPYFGMQLSPNMTLDASIGFGEGEFSSAGTDADSYRNFYALNLNYTRWLGNLQLVGKGGYLAAHERYGNTRTNGVDNANTASKNRLEQFRLGGEIGYWMDGYMPYVGLAYTDDLSRATAANVADWDGSALVMSIGMNFYSLKHGVTGGIHYTQEADRSHNDAYSLMANVNMRF